MLAEGEVSAGIEVNLLRRKPAQEIPAHVTVLGQSHGGARWRRWSGRAESPMYTQASATRWPTLRDRPGGLSHVQDWRPVVIGTDRTARSLDSVDRFLRRPASVLVASPISTKLWEPYLAGTRMTRKGIWLPRE
jgi:hypothetical protein